MQTSPPSVVTLVCLAIGVVMAVWAIRLSMRNTLRSQNPQDLAMRITAGIWLAHLLLTTGFNYLAYKLPNVSLPLVYAAHLGYQALVFGISVFLLTSAGVVKASVYKFLTVLGLAGLVALHWGGWAFEADNNVLIQSNSYLVWLGINLVAAVLVLAAVGHAALRAKTPPAVLAFFAALVGTGLCLDQAIIGEFGPRIILLLHLMYAGFLILIWQLSLHRLLPGQGAMQSADFDRSSYLEPLTGFIDAHEAANTALAAVAQERRRIGQDLHDGVGSQLVSILSSLDTAAPQQQAVALAIEQCLVDLKMTVDAMDSANDNVLDALGRLRYRIQHSLDKLGVRVLWRVELREELEAVRGPQAQQTLRIAQESLANIMRHAKASAVEVVCRYVPESALMVMEIRDNGQGIAPSDGSTRRGKGLEGMRQRAQAIGGELSISSKPGMGTRVRLIVPVPTGPNAASQTPSPFALRDAANETGPSGLTAL